MSSESEEVSSAPASESGEISQETSARGENFQFCVVTVLGLALKEGGVPPAEVILHK